MKLNNKKKKFRFVQTIRHTLESILSFAILFCINWKHFPSFSVYGGEKWNLMWFRFWLHSLSFVNLLIIPGQRKRKINTLEKKPRTGMNKLAGLLRVSQKKKIVNIFISIWT